MKTNFEYIIERGRNRQEVMFDFYAATMFYNSLSPESQGIIADIFTYNGHAYYSTVTHSLNKFHYTDDNQGVSFDNEREMEMYLDGIDPTERLPYKEPSTRFNLSKSEPEPEHNQEQEFWNMDLFDDETITDLLTTVDSGNMIGIVSETAGGIIAYAVNQEQADKLCSILNNNYVKPEDNNKFGGNWCLEDIKEHAKQMNDDEGYELSDEQARSIADAIENGHDASIGINWEVIEVYIDDYVRDNPEEFED